MKSVQPVYELSDRKQFVHDRGELFDPRCCIDGSSQADLTVKTYGKINPKNRAIKYIESMIPDLYEGNREKAVNAFVYRFENETENKPSRADMLEAYAVILSHINDDRWNKENSSKFLKRIDQNFN
jgi:hypothetical protein